jgi:hypothetical protein
MSVMEDASEHFERGNYQAAMDAWLKAAEEGDDQAEYLLGQLYSQGEAVEKDYQRAHDHFVKAANNGHTEAEYSLGVMYGIGLGIDEDIR